MSRFEICFGKYKITYKYFATQKMRTIGKLSACQVITKLWQKKYLLSCEKKQGQMKCEKKFKKIYIKKIHFAEIKSICASLTFYVEEIKYYKKKILNHI